MYRRVNQCLLGVLLLLAGFRTADEPRAAGSSLPEPTPPFSAVLHYNIYTFNVSATGAGPVRALVVKAFRGELLLTRFQLPADGAVVGAEVADLDGNRFPELYIYTSSDGSGSFGHVYAWQFLPEEKADIELVNWLKTPAGYMGHDSLWVEQDVLCRKYPVYKPGDTNAQPSGGVGMLRYKLLLAGDHYNLTPEN